MEVILRSSAQTSTSTNQTEETRPFGKKKPLQSPAEFAILSISLLLPPSQSNTTLAKLTHRSIFRLAIFSQPENEFRSGEQ
jgi:hypothetical protein